MDKNKKGHRKGMGGRRGKGEWGGAKEVIERGD